MIDAIIATMAHTRNQTLKLVADLTEDQMAYQPTAGVNHPAWVLGHLLLVEYNFLKLLGGEGPTADAKWAEIYGAKSVPVEDPEKYETKAFYLEKMAAIRGRIIERLKGMTMEDFAKPHPDPARRERFPTVGHAVLLYGTFHEAYHAGQVSAWRRVQGLPAV